MSKQVYISADYSDIDGDLKVVEELNKWGNDDKHKVDFIDMSKVSSGSVSDDPDCRICDLKEEFNKQINASSAVIFIVGEKTASRLAGNTCERGDNKQGKCNCTPYKQNTNGIRACKVRSTCPPGDDVGCINAYSYLEHEFKQAKKRKKTIIIVYNSSKDEKSWLPPYMKGFEQIAKPFWIKGSGDYDFIKGALGCA